MKKQILALASITMIAGVVTFSSCNQEDVTAPVITVTGGNTQSQSLPATAGAGTWTNPTATATDEEDGDLSTSITVTGTVDPDTKGSYTLTYTVSDAAGNTATETVTVNIVNDAEFLAGNWAVEDSVYNPLPPFVSNYNEVITTDNFVNNKIWVTRFGNYDNAIYAIMVSGGGTVVNMPTPAPTVNCGTPANDRQFTNSFSQGGTITGTGAAGTTIVLDYKETVLTPPSTANAVATYVKQ